MFGAPRKLSARSIMGLVVVIAVAVAGSLQPVVWQFLDERCLGPFVTRLQYICFWSGLILAWYLLQTPSERLIAYGWVIFVTVHMFLLLSRPQVGHFRDYNMYLQQGMTLAMFMLWVAGVIVGRVAAKRQRDVASIGKA